MHVSGAAALRSRLEQQRHWRLADGVQEGRQPRVDPDLSVLRAFRDTERWYDDDEGSFVKRLIDGDWARVEIAQDSRALVASHPL